MKLKIALMVAFCAVVNTFAQNERFFYEYKSVKDSTKKDKITNEMMVLEITKKGSTFYNYSKYKRDSAQIAKVLNQQGGAKGQIRASVHKVGETNNRVSKMYPDYKVNLHTIIGGYGYKILDERKINWKILPDKQKIGEWNAQKATAEFAGRKWVAWYAEDIPLPDGPYKFHGLPGLIVKVEDTQGYHSFELKGVSKITSDIANAPEMHRPNEIEIDRKKYKKVFWEDRDDPARQVRQMMQTGGNITFMKNGKEETEPAKMMKSIEDSAKERVKKDNNHLEIDMLTR